MLVWKLLLFIFALVHAQEEKMIKLTKEQVDQRAIEADKYITFITPENFDDFIKDGIRFVFFGARWCKLNPRWLKVQEGVLKNKAFKDKDFKLAKIDCTEAENFCASKEALGYPTLMLYSDGKIFEEYTGEHKTKNIGEYLVQKVQFIEYLKTKSDTPDPITDEHDDEEL
ncbi:Thioredoxin domain-containing protein 5 [Boothiomyces sp. JEL0838]|nr:Thioredoxin domain-containing protein 5 [Boothiomyces sp. JEL0838]